MNALFVNRLNALGLDHPAVTAALNRRAWLLSVNFSAFKSTSVDNTSVVLVPHTSGEVCRGGDTVQAVSGDFGTGSRF